MKITYIELVNLLTKKYNITQNEIIKILFYVSKKIKDLNSFIMFGNNIIPCNEIRKIELACIKIFKNKIPIEKVFKKIYFCGLNIKINNKVFFPRIETEFVINKAIEIIKLNNIKNIYDLCSGTGIIGLAIKKQINNINAKLIDIDKNCIDNINENAKMNNLDIVVEQTDALNFKIAHENSLIISNPPYVSEHNLKSNMTKYENKIAFTPKDELNVFYKKIILNNKNSKIVFEISYEQKDTLESWLIENKINYMFLKDYVNWRILLINII